jgi:hypothetical protein
VTASCKHTSFPVPKLQLFETFKAINSAQVSGNVTTILSVAIAANNTVIYWDHWEDGYELDPANPVQSTTEVWGMGTGPHPETYEWTVHRFGKRCPCVRQ